MPHEEINKILPPDIVFPVLGLLMAVGIILVIFKAMRENGMLRDPTEAELVDARERPATFAINQFFKVLILMVLVLLVGSFTSCGTEGLRTLLTMPN